MRGARCICLGQRATRRDCPKKRGERRREFGASRQLFGVSLTPAVAEGQDSYQKMTVAAKQIADMNISPDQS